MFARLNLYRIGLRGSEAAEWTGRCNTPHILSGMAAVAGLVHPSYLLPANQRTEHNIFVCF